MSQHTPEEILLVGIQEVMHLTSHPTQGHHLRTRKYTEAILRVAGPELGLTTDQCRLIGWYSALHDVGKVSIRPSILEKPGRLTEEEYDLVRQHTIVGETWFNKVMYSLGTDFVSDPGMLRNIIVQHHERLDGSGYPWGLQGDEISMEAQVVMVADIFDAMTSKRTYDRVHTSLESLDEIQTMADQGKLNQTVVNGLRIMVHQVNS